MKVERLIVARVRVKLPAEPKVIEMPEHLVGQVTPVEPVNPQPVTEPSLAQDPSAEHEQSSRETGITLSKRSIVILSVIAAILLLFLIGIIMSQRNSSETPQTLGAATEQSEPRRYYNLVSKFVELPANELPTVANVSEADKVRAQNAALTEVKDGDKMLFFARSRKVVVYRPDTNKVVAVVSLAQPTTPVK